MRRLLKKTAKVSIMNYVLVQKLRAHIETKHKKGGAADSEDKTLLIGRTLNIGPFSEKNLLFND